MYSINQSIMKKITLITLSFLFFACSKKEVLLPQLDETIVADVKDLSPIYMFFETNGKDTLIDVNRNNSISSTNWLFNIDKRLPLKLVIPEIQKLQAKKEKSVHKSETSENYFTYMDKNKKALAFMPFGEVEFSFNKPSLGSNIIYFDRDGKIFFNNQLLSKKELDKYINSLLIERESNICIGYNKNLSYEDYLKYRLLAKKIVITKLGLSVDYTKEFVY